MPQVDEKVQKIDIAQDAYIFARRGTYYLRINLPHRKQFVRTLKERIEDGAEARKNAIAKGQILHDEITQRIETGLTPEKLTIPKLAELLLKEGEEGIKINHEAGRDIARINGGRGVWSKPTLSLFQTTINRQIIPFCEHHDLKNKDVTLITQMDMDRWIAWRTKNFPEEQKRILACMVLWTVLLNSTPKENPNHIKQLLY